MKIGIDIDDTVANTNELLISMGLEFDKEYCLGKGLNNPKAYEFTELFYWNRDDVEKFFLYFLNNNGYDKIEPKMDAILYIKKLKELGCDITFITYRQSRNGFNTYDISKSWLDKYGFCYDGLIADSGDKGIVCKKLGIDLFIDDSVRQINDINSYGIKTVLFDTIYNRYAKNYNRLRNWQEIYDLVRGIIDERGNI